MTTPINVALIGLGQRGLQHLRALWQLQSEGKVRLVALADAFADNIVETKIQQYVPGFEIGEILMTTEVEKLFDMHAQGPKIEALYLAIPPNVHQGEVVRAAEAGMHIFAEKPMSLYLDEAIEMNEAIRQAGVISGVGFQQRFDVRHEAMQTFLADKNVVMASYMFHAPFERHSVKHTKTDTVGGPVNRVWTANQAWSGMTVVEGGIHPLDLWRYWFGDVAWVRANYVHRPPEEIFDQADNPYVYDVTFGFENGAIGSMNLSRLRRVFHTQSHHMVLWNEGHLVLEGGEVAAYHYDGPYPPIDDPSTETLRQTLDLAPPKNTTYAISEAFIEAVANQDQTLVRSSFHDAMNSLTAVLAANVSDQLGGQRVELEALLRDQAYAKFRQKPEAGR